MQSCFKSTDTWLHNTNLPVALDVVLVHFFTRQSKMDCIGCVGSFILVLHDIRVQVMENKLLMHVIIAILMSTQIP